MYQSIRALLFGLLFVCASAFAEVPNSAIPLDDRARGADLNTPASMPSVALRLPRPEYQIETSLSKDGASVSGVVRITFENVTTAPLTEALLMLYPNRFAQRPSYLNELNQGQHYPGSYSPSEMKLSDVSVGGQPSASVAYEKGAEGERLFARVALPQEVAPGERVTLSMQFTTTIPERYGRFGRAEDAIVLDGGFYPQLAYLNQSGFSTTRPPRPGVFSVALSAPGYEGSFWVNGQGPFTAQDATKLALGEAPYLSWVLLAQHRVQSEYALSAEAGAGLPVQTEGAPQITYFYTDDLAKDKTDWDERTPGLNSNAARDYPKEVTSAVIEGLVFLEGLGYDVKGREFRLIEVPLREHVARVSPGMILISDRAMKIYPYEKILKFHKLQILRALYSQLAEERIAGFEQEEDLAWVSDALGAYLSDLYHLKGFLKQDFAKEMLKPFSFISEIDRLRWVPQVSFKDAYFKTAYEQDLFRDDVRRFPQRWPYGKFIYGKLRALIGVERFIAMARVYLSGEQRTPFRALSETYYAEPLGWFYQQWMGPHPQINYKLVSYQSKATSAGYQNEVVVTKEGQTWVKEPIEVLVTYTNGARELMEWPLGEVSHTFSWESKAPIDSVHVDPGDSTLEVIRGVSDDLKFDNRSPKRWRVVWDGVGADASANGITVATSGSARQAHDKRNFYFLSTAAGSGTLAGFDTENLRLNQFGSVSTGYSRAFGIGLDEDRLTARAGATLSGAYLGPSVTDQDQDEVLEFVPPAGFFRLSLFTSYSNRLAFLNPWTGTSASLSASYSAGFSTNAEAPVLDGAPMELRDTCTAASGLCQSVAFGLNGAKLFSLDGGKVLGLRLTGSTLVGTPLGQSFFDLGGSSNLKGYPINVIEGRSRVFGSIEYRHPFWQNTDVNLLEVLRMRSLYGIFWLDGASISDQGELFNADARSLFGRGSFFADAGAGLRLTGDYLGIDPSLLSLDIATPLVGSQAFNPNNPFPAIQFYLGFEQNF